MIITVRYHGGVASDTFDEVDTAFLDGDQTFIKTFRAVETDFERDPFMSEDRKPIIQRYRIGFAEHDVLGNIYWNAFFVEDFKL